MNLEKDRTNSFFDKKRSSTEEGRGRPFLRRGSTGDRSYIFYKEGFRAYIPVWASGSCRLIPIHRYWCATTVWMEHKRYIEARILYARIRHMCHIPSGAQTALESAYTYVHVSHLNITRYHITPYHAIISCHTYHCTDCNPFLLSFFGRRRSSCLGHPGMLGENIPRRVEGEGGAGAGFLVLQRRDCGVLGRQHSPDGHHRP